MNFNLEKEYEALIDKYCSFFSQMCAQDFCNLEDLTFCTYYKTFNEFFSKLPLDATIAVYGVGAYTRNMIGFLSAANRQKIAYYACTSADQEDLMFEGRKVLSPNELKSKNVDFVILSSWDYKHEMRETLLEIGFAEEQLLDIDLKPINLPAYMVRDERIYSNTCCLNKIKLSVNDFASVFAYYESSGYFTSNQNRIIALYSLIIGFIVAKDIVNIRRFSREYIEKKYPMYKSLKAFVQDLDALIDRVYERIHARKEDAVVIYMLDAFEYCFLEQMPNIENLYKKSLVFNKAFTQYAYTTPSLQVMFTGKDLIDDKAYETEYFTVENSPLLRTLKDNGYQLEVIRGEGRYQLFSHSPEITLHPTLNIASHMFFEMLTILSSCDKKQMLYLHVYETHPPFASPFGNQHEQNSLSRFKSDRAKAAVGARALAYVDEQLAFADDFLSPETTRVVMSDHGTRPNPQNMLNSAAAAEHYKYVNDMFIGTRIALFVYSPQLESRTINEIFCIKNFDLFLRFLFGKGDIESLASPYVKLQKLPPYDKWVFDHSWPLTMPERGIISHNGVYIYSYDGCEYYYPNKFKNHINDPTYSEEIEKMRELCGKDFYDLFEQPKFAFTKKVYLEKGLIKEKEECTV